MKDMKDLKHITEEGLKLALSLQQGGYQSDATVVLLANLLTATLHNASVLEEISVKLDKQ